MPNDASRSWIDIVEAVFACVVIVMMTSPGLLLLGVSEDPNAPDNPAFRLYWVAPYLIILGLSVLRARTLVRFWAPMVLMLAVVGWAFASKYWSIDPDTTGRRVEALALTTLFGFYLGAAFDDRRFVDLMGISFMILAVGSLALVVAIPRFGIDHAANAGDWRGLWIEKNTLALFMVPGGLVALCAALQSPRRWWLWAGMLALCVLLLVMSKGKTALLCFVIAMGVAAVIWLMRRGLVIGVMTFWATVTAASVIGFILWQAPGLLLTAVGKDPTLTGRTEIWSSVLAQVAKHPLTGFGFAAFWGKDSIPAMIIRAQTHWTVPTAHNGWIDLLVQVGWVGVGLFAVVFVIAIVATVLRTIRTREYFGLVFLIIFGVFSLTESFLEEHNSLFWALFVTVLTHALGPTPEPQRRSAPFRRPQPTLRLQS